MTAAGRRGDRPARRARRSWPAAATRRPTRSASGRSCPGAWPCRSGRRASSSRRPTAPLFEPRGPRPRVLPRGARAVAHDVGDAVGRRQPALVPRRRWRPGDAFGDAGRRRRPTCRRAATACCSCPTSSGERSPHPDPLARGAFVGLTLAPRPAPPHPGRAGGRGVRPARRARPDDRRRDAGAGPDPGIGRRHGERAVAPDPRRRPRGGDRDRRARPRAPPTGPALLAAVGAGWFPTRRGRGRRRGRRDAGRRTPGPDAAALRRGPRRATATCTRRSRRRSARPVAGRRPTGRYPWSSASSVSDTSSGFLPMMIIAEDLVLGDVVLVRRCRRACPGA